MLLLALILSACQPGVAPATAPGGSPNPAATLITTAVPTAAAANQFIPTGAILNVVHIARWGEVLADGRGMTLYISNFDAPDKSNCDAPCLEEWEPLLAEDEFKLGAGIEASLVGVAALADGSKVITYGHRPLYRFLRDKQPGDFGGQGYLNSWYMVMPDGTPHEQLEGAAGQRDAASSG